MKTNLNQSGWNVRRRWTRLQRRVVGIILIIASWQPLHAQIAVRGEVVYTMAGDPLRPGVVLVRDHKIERVGPATEIVIPDGYQTLEAKVVTPGLVDARTAVGLAGMYNYAHDRSELERSDPIQPELRAIDAYNPREPLVEWIRNLGTTTIHTGHAPGALASGGTIIVKTVGETVYESLLDSVGMVAFTLGESVMHNFQSPGTRAKSVAMIRSQLLKAEEYRQKRKEKDPEKRPSRDLKLEALADVLEGKRKALFTAHRTTEIMSALRLQREFAFPMVLDGAAEAYLLLDEIKSAGIPIIIHPPMIRPFGDASNISFETPLKLKEAGILFAFQSGYEGYVPRTRVLLFEAAIAARHGLPFVDALAAITIHAARIIGVDHLVGSLEVGKDADMVLFDGDPFEYTTRVCGVIINGNLVSEQCR